MRLMQIGTVARRPGQTATSCRQKQRTGSSFAVGSTRLHASRMVRDCKSVRAKPVYRQVAGSHGFCRMHILPVAIGPATDNVTTSTCSIDGRGNLGCAGCHARPVQMLLKMTPQPASVREPTSFPGFPGRRLQYVRPAIATYPV